MAGVYAGLYSNHKTETPEGCFHSFGLFPQTVTAAAFFEHDNAVVLSEDQKSIRGSRAPLADPDPFSAALRTDDDASDQTASMKNKLSGSRVRMKRTRLKFYVVFV